VVAALFGRGWEKESKSTCMCDDSFYTLTVEKYVVEMPPLNECTPNPINKKGGCTIISGAPLIYNYARKRTP
jgi:hypothetical protein